MGDRGLEAGGTGDRTDFKIPGGEPLLAGALLAALHERLFGEGG